MVAWSKLHSLALSSLCHQRGDGRIKLVNIFAVKFDEDHFGVEDDSSESSALRCDQLRHSRGCSLIWLMSSRCGLGSVFCAYSFIFTSTFNKKKDVVTLQAYSDTTRWHHYIGKSQNKNGVRITSIRRYLLIPSPPWDNVRPFPFWSDIGDQKDSFQIRGPR